MESDNRASMLMLRLRRPRQTWHDVRLLCVDLGVVSIMFAGMNLLSGVTWKGAKLRLGEAKPDYRERYVIPAGYKLWLSHAGS